MSSFSSFGRNLKPTWMSGLALCCQAGAIWLEQSGKFSVARIYDSGHELPFTSPWWRWKCSKELSKDWDVATGETGGKCKLCHHRYAKELPFGRENSTIQFKVVGTDSTSNTTTN